MNAKVVEGFVHQLIFFIIFLYFPCFSLETDSVSPGSIIKDPDTIISSGQIFKFGFFTPENTTNRYLGVFYAVSENTVIWVANRDKPLNDSSSAATVTEDGNLVLINARNQTVWSTNATTSPINTTLQILDTGNLVLREGITGNTIWESFSHPSDVFLPSMKISHNIRTGKKVFLSSWKNVTDPQVGSFTAGVEALDIPQTLIWNKGRRHWRSGPWNGLIFMGIQDMYSPYSDGLTGVKNDSDGTVYYYMNSQRDFLFKFQLNSSGTLVETMWSDQKKTWDTIYLAPKNVCDVYGTCGPFGSCNSLDSPICSCLRGFEPSNKEEWDRGNWTSGCKRRNQLQCSTGGARDGFSRLQFMKVPDFAEPFYSREEGECRSRCLGNCSCLAYAHDSYIGCMFWRDTLIDVQRFDGVGVDLYIRLSASEFDNHKGKKLYIIIPVTVGFVCISILIFVGCWLMAKRRGQRFTSGSTPTLLKDKSKKVYMGELPVFTFEKLEMATDRFHEGNLLGMGGFGPVYKGTLDNGVEIAVKRLSAASGQGIEEFMNEVVVISKLQHRNLVRLLGCCVERGEKMLIYEYMPNKSLDVCLFDPTHPSQNILDWNKRFSIIEGIGRGLLYLHKDSRLRIIHRDLKPSNVLLDEDWNPKISDFGMARIFGVNQEHIDTARVVGTYGYMAPEYAMEGRFSEKSDVYSFGVLILEIIKGQKNAHYYNHELSLSLIGSAWKLWSEDKSLAFADESIASLDVKAEIMRCIQIGLLCVQEYPKDRPTIQTVLSMLSREIVELPAPEQPVSEENWEGLTTRSMLRANGVGHSSNEVSLTVLEGR